MSAANVIGLAISILVALAGLARMAQLDTQAQRKIDAHRRRLSVYTEGIDTAEHPRRVIWTARTKP